MKKTIVINAINDLPKEFELDALVEKLIVINKIEEGLKEVKEGKTLPHKKVKEDIEKWLK